jgi:hypothetical protein
MALTSPIAIGPLTPCSKSVRVQGQSAPATVQVFATVLGTGATRLVGKADTVSANELIPLLAGLQLKPGELVTASQRTTTDFADHLPPEFGVEVMAAPEVADLDALFSGETILECGSCLWVAGIYPGAIVTLRQNADPPLTAESASDTVKFVLPSGRRLHTMDVLTASQSACGLPGNAVSLTAPVAQVRAEWPAAGPTISPPPVKCQQHVSLSDVLPGATVVVELDGVEHRACFGYRQGTFGLPRELKVGDTLRVRQEFPMCELRSNTTEATVIDALPPPPVIAAPICEGDRIIRVDGLILDATVEFAADGVPLCRGVAADVNAPFGLPSLLGVSALTSRQSVCHAADGTWSDWSAAVPVRTLGPQASPVIVEPLVERGVAVRVTSEPWPSPKLPAPLAKGSLVQIVSQRGVLGEAWTNGDVFVDVPLWFALRRTDRVHVRTRRCGRRRDWPREVGVQNIRDVVRPRVADPACDCGGSVLVHDAVPGAIIDVFRTRASGGPTLVGTGRAGSADVSVDVPPLQSGDQLQARQRMSATTSGLGAVATAPIVPKWAYASDTAFRLCQLTKDSDPTGRPHPGPTTPIGITGTDLGIPVEHMGRLYLFFGDAAEAPGIATDADPIAWLTTADPDDLETEAPDLHWVLGGNGKFRRLTLTDGPELGNFEVPTGAFSYDSRIHVFVTTDRMDNPLRMTASRLVVANDPANNFTNVLIISSTTGGQILVLNPDGTIDPAPYPGKRWMLHISPTVVRNADWPGLPSSTGEGLLMFGSSLYRGVPVSDLTPTEITLGNVYLAWAPLTPGAAPPKSPIPDPSEWKFFTGLNASGKPVWGTLAGGSTPTPILPPDPSGPRMLGEISAAWYPGLRRWILAGSVPAPINLARMPWGPWTTSDTICDAGNAQKDAGNSQAGGLWNDTKVTYAPYLVSRWSRWDRSTRRTTVYFTLSVFDLPNNQRRYQPQLMRSAIECWS